MTLAITADFFVFPQHTHIDEKLLGPIYAGIRR
jgi:hypothetical protein